MLNSVDCAPSIVHVFHFESEHANLEGDGSRSILKGVDGAASLGCSIFWSESSLSRGQRADLDRGRSCTV